MEPLTWTGSLGTLLDPLFLIAGRGLAVTRSCRSSLLSLAPVSYETNRPTARGPSAAACAACRNWRRLDPRLPRCHRARLYPGGILHAPWRGKGIVGAIAKQFLPVWVALIVTFAASIRFRRRLGLYGKLFDSTVGMIGFAIVVFWVFTAIFVGDSA
jgi:peptide/nickel transport system permease protein